MKRLYVMNSAMMPQDGVYSRVLIEDSEVKKLICEADEIVSSISYQSVTDVLFNISGYKIPLDKEKKLTKFDESCATILVAKLKYRVPSERKGRLECTVDDYEFFRVDYESYNKVPCTIKNVYNALSEEIKSKGYKLTEDELTLALLKFKKFNIDGYNQLGLRKRVLELLSKVYAIRFCNDGIVRFRDRVAKVKSAYRSCISYAEASDMTIPCIMIEVRASRRGVKASEVIALISKNYLMEESNLPEAEGRTFKLTKL